MTAIVYSLLFVVLMCDATNAISCFEFDSDAESIKTSDGNYFCEANFSTDDDDLSLFKGSKVVLDDSSNKTTICSTKKLDICGATINAHFCRCFTDFCNQPTSFKEFQFRHFGSI